MSNLVDFMSHALAQEECKIGGHTFDSVAGLSGKEFLMTQSIGLFVVANDTNSTFISHLFYELSHNVDVQQRLQASILILQCHLVALFEGQKFHFGTIVIKKYLKKSKKHPGFYKGMAKSHCMCFRLRLMRPSRGRTRREPCSNTAPYKDCSTWGW